MQHVIDNNNGNDNDDDAIKFDLNSDDDHTSNGFAHNAYDDNYNDYHGNDDDYAPDSICDTDCETDADADDDVDGYDNGDDDAGIDGDADFNANEDARDTIYRRFIQDMLQSNMWTVLLVSEYMLARWTTGQRPMTLLSDPMIIITSMFQKLMIAIVRAYENVEILRNIFENYLQVEQDASAFVAGDFGYLTTSKITDILNLKNIDNLNYTDDLTIVLRNCNKLMSLPLMRRECFFTHYLFAFWNDICPMYKIRQSMQGGVSGMLWLSNDTVIDEFMDHTMHIIQVSVNDVGGTDVPDSDRAIPTHQIFSSGKNVNPIDDDSDDNNDCTLMHELTFDEEVPYTNDARNIMPMLDRYHYSSRKNRVLQLIDKTTLIYSDESIDPSSTQVEPIGVQMRGIWWAPSFPSIFDPIATQEPSSKITRLSIHNDMVLDPVLERSINLAQDHRLEWLEFVRFHLKLQPEIDYIIHKYVRPSDVLVLSEGCMTFVNFIRILNIVRPSTLILISHKIIDNDDDGGSSSHAIDDVEIPQIHNLFAYDMTPPYRSTLIKLINKSTHYSEMFNNCEIVGIDIGDLYSKINDRNSMSIYVTDPVCYPLICTVPSVGCKFKTMDIHCMHIHLSDERGNDLTFVNNSTTTHGSSGTVFNHCIEPIQMTSDSDNFFRNCTCGCTWVCEELMKLSKDDEHLVHKTAIACRLFPKTPRAGTLDDSCVPIVENNKTICYECDDYCNVVGSFIEMSKISMKILQIYTNNIDAKTVANVTSVELLEMWNMERELDRLSFCGLCKKAIQSNEYFTNTFMKHIDESRSIISDMASDYIFVNKSDREWKMHMNWMSMVGDILIPITIVPSHTLSQPTSFVELYNLSCQCYIIVTTMDNVIDVMSRYYTDKLDIYFYILDINAYENDIPIATMLHEEHGAYVCGINVINNECLELWSMCKFVEQMHYKVLNGRELTSRDHTMLEMYENNRYDVPMYDTESNTPNVIHSHAHVESLFSVFLQLRDPDYNIVSYAIEPYNDANTRDFTFYTKFHDYVSNVLYVSSNKLPLDNDMLKNIRKVMFVYIRNYDFIAHAGKCIIDKLVKTSDGKVFVVISNELDAQLFNSVDIFGQHVDFEIIKYGSEMHIPCIMTEVPIDTHQIIYKCTFASYTDCILHFINRDGTDDPPRYTFKATLEDANSIVCTQNDIENMMHQSVQGSRSGSRSETGSGSGSETGSVSGSETGSGSGSETESGSELETESGSGSETGSGSGSETESGLDSETESGLDSETGSDRDQN